MDFVHFSRKMGIIKSDIQTGLAVKEIAIDTLRENPVENMMLYHPAGHVLLHENEPLDNDILEILEQAGLGHVILPDPGESPSLIQYELSFARISTKELFDGLVLQSPIYDMHDRLLLEAGTPITSMFRETIERMGVQELLIRKLIPEDQIAAAEALRNAIARHLRKPKFKEAMNVQESCSVFSAIKLPKAAPDDFSAQKFQNRINRLSEVAYEASGKPFVDMVRDTRVKRATAEEKNEISNLCSDCLDLCCEIFTWFARSTTNPGLGDPPIMQINQVVANVMAGVIQNQDIMALCTINAERSEYLPVHSLAVSVVACQVGMRMKLGVTQIKALVYGALLADVGLARVPKVIRMKRSRLDDFERARIKSHPSAGLDMLVPIKDLPAEVPWIVFQSHERCNGTGYPSGKRGNLIHPLAKIVGMSDIFVAMCSPRPHRPAQLPYKAVETLLQMAQTGEFEPPIVKIFLSAQSLFPVGSLIQLEDGRIAQVVSADPDSHSRPVVVPVCDSSGKILRNPGERIQLAAHPELVVARPLPNPARSRIQDQLNCF